MNKEDLVSLNYKAECDRLKQELNAQKEEIKIMIKELVYSEDGITYMSDKQYSNYINIIEQLQKENKELKLELSGYRQAILNDKEMLGLKKENKILRENAENNDKVVDKINWENLKLKEHIEKYEHYCKTTGIEDLAKENEKYKEVIDNIKYYLENSSNQMSEDSTYTLMNFIKEVE